MKMSELFDSQRVPVRRQTLKAGGRRKHRLIEPVKTNNLRKTSNEAKRL
jgi:hypothetical protein